MLGLMLGCTPLELEPTRQKVMRPAQMSADSVGLEILFVRCRLDDQEVNQTLWAEIDEQQLPADLRRQLTQNGLRAGVVGNPYPHILERLLQSDKPATAANPLPGSEGTIAKLDAEPTVTGRYLQVRAEQPSEIQTSRIFDELPLLLRQDGQVVGQTLAKVQAVLVATTHPQPAGPVRIDLVPQLQYGEQAQRIVPTNEGIWKLEAGRKRENFENLRISTALAPGQMLVVTCLPDSAGSLGHHFFADRTQGQTAQKLVLIRLSQTQHQGL